MIERLPEHSAPAKTQIRTIELVEEGPTKTAQSPSLRGLRFSPLRGVLKLLVVADGSRLTLSRLRAAVILLAALSGFALLGYLLPTLVW